jgi:uncharacterized protein YybS (DUF2232 family)
VRLLGVFGMPLGLFAPAPLVVLCVRHGQAAMLLSAALGAAGLWGGQGAEAAVAFVFAVSLPAYLIGRGLKAGWPPEIVVGTAAILLSAATYAALRMTLPDGIRPWVADLVTRTIDLYAAQGVPDETVAMLRDRAEPFTDLFFHLLPLVLMTSGIALGTASLLSARGWLVRRKAAGLAPFSPLDWHLPDIWIWALIAAAILTLVPHVGAKVAGQNALGVMAIAYALQGWAVVASIFHSRKVHALVQGAFYAVMVLWPPLAAALVLIGLTDVWTDLRKVRPQPEPPDN